MAEGKVKYTPVVSTTAVITRDDKKGACSLRVPDYEFISSPTLFFQFWTHDEKNGPEITLAAENARDLDALIENLVKFRAVLKEMENAPKGPARNAEV